MMNLLEKLPAPIAAALGAATAGIVGGKPEGRETVSDCLSALAITLLDEFIEKDGPVATEIGNLLTALKNGRDPLLEEVGPVEHMALKQLISQLEKGRRKTRGEKTSPVPSPENPSSDD